MSTLSYESRLNQLQFHSLYFRQQRSDLIEAYKIINNQYLMNPENIFITVSGSITWVHGVLASSGAVVGRCLGCTLREVETASMILGKLALISGELASKTCCSSLVCLRCCLVPPLLADVGELELPHFLDEQVWVVETSESWRTWEDLRRVEVGPFRPRVLVLGIRILCFSL